MRLSNACIIQLPFQLSESKRQIFPTGVMSHAGKAVKYNTYCGRGALKDFSPMSDLVTGDSAAEGTTDCAVLDDMDSERRYKGKITDPVRRFVVDLVEVLIIVNTNQREQTVTRIISILQPAAFNVVVFRSYVKKVGSVTTSASQ